MAFDHVDPQRVRKNEDDPLPDDRLGRMGAELIAALEKLDGYGPNIRAIICIDDADTRRGTTSLHNYDNDDPQEQLENALRHTSALFRAEGLPFQVLGIGDN